jgi:polygalacturonase
MISLALLLSATAYAEDRRHVTEPGLPTQVCALVTNNQEQNLQQALDACPAGSALKLAAGSYHSGPLRLPSGVTLWLDRGAVLLASTRPTDYDKGNGHCGTLDQNGKGCRPFIEISHAKGSAIVGDGTIDGQGGAILPGGSESWWQLARRAQTEHSHQNVPRLIDIRQSSNITLYRVHLHNAANFHVALDQVQGFTAWGVVIDTPSDARNTDGIDPGASQDVTISHTSIQTGDDNIAIKGGHGPSRYITIEDSHIYGGHGISIGSETQAGVSDVSVRNVTLDGTTWGLRIKSAADRGGLVSRIQYENICLRDNRWPISFIADYADGGTGSLIPQYQDIHLHNIQGAGGILQIKGHDASHPAQIWLDNVRFAPQASWAIQHADIRTTGPITPALPGHTADAAPASNGSDLPNTVCKNAWSNNNPADPLTD